MSKKAFIFEKTVYLGDTNAEGNVYFAKYFDWQGQAREEFVRSEIPGILGLIKSGLVMITCEAFNTYKQSAYLFDPIQIEIRTATIKKVSFGLIFIFTNKNTKALLGVGWQKIAFADTTGKFVHIPEEIEKRAHDYLEENPESLFGNTNFNPCHNI